MKAIMEWVCNSIHFSIGGGFAGNNVRRTFCLLNIGYKNGWLHGGMKIFYRSTREAA
jgi:hypothetical protein